MGAQTVYDVMEELGLAFKYLMYLILLHIVDVFWNALNWTRHKLHVALIKISILRYKAARKLIIVNVKLKHIKNN